MSSDQPYTPSNEEMLTRRTLAAPRPQIGRFRPLTQAEMMRGLARVRRDAAREALDGLYLDAQQDYTLGAQGGNQERMDAAVAVMDAALAWKDLYPEEESDG